MIVIIYAFAFLQLALLVYALARGGAPERTAAAMLVIALAASNAPRTPFGANWSLPLVDIALLIGLVVLALAADRFWPMWLAALQVIAVSTYAVERYEPGAVTWALWAVVTKIGYPICAILAIAIARHARRVRAGGSEPGWTRQRHDRGRDQAIREYGGGFPGAAVRDRRRPGKGPPAPPASGVDDR